MFFGLRTDIDKIARVLGLLASGMGVNAVCRENDVTADSLRDWIVLASNHVDEFSKVLEQDMHLEQVQIDEFWSFVRKKKKT
jgi:transposase-like protein